MVLVKWEGDMPGINPGTMPPVMMITSVVTGPIVVVVVELWLQDSMSGCGGPLTSWQVRLGELKQEQVLSWARLKLKNGYCSMAQIYEHSSGVSISPGRMSP